MPEATYFITGVTQNRLPVFAEETAVDLLRETTRYARNMHPFHMRAYVILPDHLHWLIRLETGTNISKLMQSIQRNFVLNYKRQFDIGGRIKLWQRGFWDHVIRDERDFLNHLDYTHFNPVKHGYVNRPEDYANSSYREYLRRGWYELGWGWTEPKGLAGLEFE